MSTTRQNKISRGIWASVRSKTLKKRSKKASGETDDNVCLSQQQAGILLGRIRVILAHIESNAEQDDLSPLSSTGISTEAKEAAQTLVQALVKDDTIHLVKSLQSMNCATLGAVVKLVFMSSPEPLIPGKVCSLILGTCAKYAEYLDEKDDEKVEEIGATLERFSASKNFTILEGLCQSLNRLPMGNDELAYVFAPLILLPKINMIVGEGVTTGDVDVHLSMLAAADAVIEAMQFLIDKADTLFDSRSRKRALLKKGLSARRAVEGDSQEDDPAVVIDEASLDVVLEAMATGNPAQDLETAYHSSRSIKQESLSNKVTDPSSPESLQQVPFEAASVIPDDDVTPVNTPIEELVETQQMDCATGISGKLQVPPNESTSKSNSTKSVISLTKFTNSVEEQDQSEEGIGIDCPQIEINSSDIVLQSLEDAQACDNDTSETCNGMSPPTSVVIDASQIGDPILSKEVQSSSEDSPEIFDTTSTEQKGEEEQEDSDRSEKTTLPLGMHQSCTSESELLNISGSKEGAPNQVNLTDKNSESDPQPDLELDLNAAAVKEISNSEQDYSGENDQMKRDFIQETLSLTLPPSLNLSILEGESKTSQSFVNEDLDETQKFLQCPSPSGSEVSDQSFASHLSGKLRDLEEQTPVCKAVVLYDYEPHEDGEISLMCGEIVEVLEMEEDGWWYGRAANGDVGVFPGVYVKSLYDDDDFAEVTSNHKDGNARTPRSASSTFSQGKPSVSGKDAAGALTSLLQTYNKLVAVVGHPEGIAPLPTTHQMGPVVQDLLDRVLARLELAETEVKALRAA